MEKDDFLIQKGSFIKSRRENILHFYDFHPKEIGKRAYGVVYRAREKGGKGEWRGVKKIAKRKIKQPELLINEIEVLKGLDHPTCIKLYETFEDEQSVFLVTE